MSTTRTHGHTANVKAPHSASDPSAGNPRRRGRSGSPIRTPGRLESLSSRLSPTGTVKPQRHRHGPSKGSCGQGSQRRSPAPSSKRHTPPVSPAHPHGPQSPDPAARTRVRGNSPCSKRAATTPTPTTTSTAQRESGPSCLRARALLGDAVLRMILVHHFMKNPTSSAGNIHTRIAGFLTNNHLRDCFPRIYDDILRRGEESLGLLPPTGFSRADGTQVEAWIHTMMVTADGDMAAVALRVLPLIGVGADDFDN